MKKILILCLTFMIATELEVDGNLKVTGSVNASGNPITNVGEPVLTTDVATANYVNLRTAGKGRIITLKCPWFTYCGSTFCNDQYATSAGNCSAVGTCDLPECPIGWEELITFDELVSSSANSQYGCLKMIGGNAIRYCIEQETEE